MLYLIYSLFSPQKTNKNRKMKLPKKIRLNYWYINRLPITLITVILIALYCIATLLLNLINLI